MDFGIELARNSFDTVEHIGARAEESFDAVEPPRAELAFIDRCCQAADDDL